jgi:hypothetical protein
MYCLNTAAAPSPAEAGAGESGVTAMPSKVWKWLGSANRQWMCGSIGAIIFVVALSHWTASSAGRVAGTPVGLTFGVLAFALLLASGAYSLRKRWRPLVAQRSLGGRRWRLHRKHRRSARIEEAQAAIADLQSEISREALKDRAEIMRRTRRQLQKIGARRLLRIDLELGVDGHVRIWTREREPAGSLQNWLLAHSYLGLLAALVGTLHTGWRLGGSVATLALFLLWIVALSGLVGTALYVIIPRSLGGIRRPMLPPEIRVRIAEVERAMAAVVKEKSGPFQEIFLSSSNELSGEDISRVEDEEKASFQQMLELQAQKQALQAYLAKHLRYEWWLRAWLYVHLPAAAFLLVVASTHVLAILYY